MIKIPGVFNMQYAPVEDVVRGKEGASLETSGQRFIGKATIRMLCGHDLRSTVPIATVRWWGHNTSYAYSLRGSTHLYSHLQYNTKLRPMLASYLADAATCGTGL
jgi:hypothetical protein